MCNFCVNFCSVYIFWLKLAEVHAGVVGESSDVMAPVSWTSLDAKPDILIGEKVNLLCKRIHYCDVDKLFCVRCLPNDEEVYDGAVNVCLQAGDKIFADITCSLESL